ncbi:MAG: S9 family peptidase [Bacteroidetes bacterium]|jgi:dipeptidyl aminopeptidase/acylaminoacyl peptidase|nr:S9 family peptidase [Bacteroidota bacterium]
MKTKLYLLLIFIALSFSSQNLAGQTNQKYFDWEAYNKESTSLDDLQFSPDGKYLFYTTKNADFETNKWDRKYRLMNLLTKEDSILKFDQKDVRRIKWSPSGKYMSFIASVDGKSQIHIKGFPTGPTKVISNHSSNISNFYWSHDESKITFVAKDLPSAKKESEKFITAYEVGPQGYLVEGEPVSTHLYLLDLINKSETRLTEGSWTINSEISWSLDDEKLVFTKKADAYSSRWNNSEIVYFDLMTKSLLPFSNNTKFEFGPEFTPKNNHLLYWTATDGNPAGLTDIIIKDEDESTINLTSTLDRNIKSFDWLESQNGILAYGPDGTTDGVWVISFEGKIKKTPLSNKFVIRDLVINKDGNIALLASAGNQPREIFYLDDYTAEPVQLTHYNEAFKKMKLGQVESIEWETDLNITTNGIVTYPPNFSAENKYPLVIYIHGGPTASSLEWFNARSQEMARNGWIVFQPNYRGSNNLGDAFQEAIMNDGGEGPGKDVMAGIEALKSRGYIDETKISVSGWSYGGYMTAWLIGRYPDVWKAAVAGAAPVDYTDMTSLSRMNMTLRHAITNSPWVGDNYQIHYDMSPLKNLSKIKTPTLIMSKVEDQVVTVTGSYKLYHALIANNIPVKFIAYPGGGHSPSDPVNRKDVFDRWVAWLKIYLD